MSFAPLPEDQTRRAQQLFDSFMAAAHNLRAGAELLATQPDDQLVGDVKAAQGAEGAGVAGQVGRAGDHLDGLPGGDSRQALAQLD